MGLFSPCSCAVFRSCMLEHQPTHYGSRYWTLATAAPPLAGCRLKLAEL